MAKGKNKGLQGHCAKCGSENIYYRNLIVDGQDAHYPYDCDDCKHKGQEKYYMEHVESV